MVTSPPPGRRPYQRAAVTDDGPGRPRPMIAESVAMVVTSTNVRLTFEGLVKRLRPVMTDKPNDFKLPFNRAAWVCANSPDA